MNNETVMRLRVKALDIDPDVPPSAQVDEIVSNLWDGSGSGGGGRNSKDGPLASDIFLFREGLRLQPHLAPVTPPKNDYPNLPNGCGGGDRFQLLLPAASKKLISDLEFTHLAPYVLEEGELEVEVKAVSLNVRDVMTVVKPAVPAEFDDGFNVNGLDVAGVVTRVGPGVEGWVVGERVIGMQGMDPGLALAMASHVRMREEHAAPLPQHMTMAEGSTLPTAFSTAYYSLVKVAGMKAGETILIHTASGGVGLIAIQLAKRIGVEVIATAGSERKRTFLRNLGIQHVFSSRSTEYGTQILEVTGGSGVDIVLNSLTGLGFKEESLRALRTNGRFVEMSKMNVWKVEEVRELRPDVKYSLVDLTTLEESEYTELVSTLKTDMEGGGGVGGSAIQPLPYERFDGPNIRGALNRLQKAEHVGRIVCIMPERNGKGNNNTYDHGRTPLLNGDSTYLVTGGLGGIGFEVVKWILRSGWVRVAIASRRPPNPEMAAKIEALNKEGGGKAHVAAFVRDVGSFDQCQKLFDELQEGDCWPPLRGIMHAAGVLADATIDNQTWDSFRSTYNPKVSGTWNLHNLSKSRLLEHFVLFSSVSATFGSPGQSNYAAGNCFQDSFAHYRRSLGLPATSINWGPWGEVGMAAELHFPGISPIPIAQGLAALDACLRSLRTQSAVVNIDLIPVLANLLPRLSAYLDADKRLIGEVGRREGYPFSSSSSLVNNEQLLAALEAAPGREGRVTILKSHIIGVVRSTLSLDPSDPLDDSTPFHSAGLDSLMMLEMRNILQTAFGSSLTIGVTQLKDCITPQLLANRLVDLLELEGQAEEEMKAPAKSTSPPPFQNTIDQ